MLLMVKKRMIESQYKISSYLRGHKKYKEWLKIIRNRDNNICQKCEILGTNEFVNVHHIIEMVEILKRNNVFTRQEGINCDELWDVSNGISLCTDCHPKTYNRKNGELTILREK